MIYSRAVSNLTEAEFIRIVSAKEPQIKDYLRRIPFSQRLQLRRDIQIALTRFSKGKPILNVVEGDNVHMTSNREVLLNSHAIQLRALRVCQIIENNARNAYIEQMKSKIIFRYPEFSKNPQKVKSMAKKKWSKFLLKHSY